MIGPLFRSADELKIRPSANTSAGSQRIFMRKTTPGLSCVNKNGRGLDLAAIAAEVGYVEGAVSRTLLRERFARGLRELRADRRRRFPRTKKHLADNHFVC